MNQISTNIYVIFKVQFDFALEVWFSIYSYTRAEQKIRRICW